LMDTQAQAGWAEVDITPPLGLPMGGRGPRYAPGTEILDPLMAQALVLVDGFGSRQLWISLDLIGLSYARSSALRYELSAVTGIPYHAIVINFAHTHSGPMTNFEKYPGYLEEPANLLAYHENLRRKIILMAQEAASHTEPVTICLHHGHSDIGVNRRRRLETGDITLAPNPGGAYNADLWVLDIQATTSEHRCIVFTIGCHPVIVYGYKWQGISADYPGACRHELRQEFGDAVHCQFVQGLAGNIRPRILADNTTGIFRQSNANDHLKAGQSLARDISLALSKAGTLLDLHLKSRVRWVPALRDPQQILPLTAWEEMAKSEHELTRNVGQYWAQRMESGLPLAQASPMEVGVLHLDAKHVIAWFSAEAVAEWLPIIRNCDRALRIVAWGYCQFVPTYLPTDALLAEGGYEVINANIYEVNGPGPFAPGLDITFTSVFCDLLA
jgi:neutral ceramidase